MRSDPPIRLTMTREEWSFLSHQLTSRIFATKDYPELNKKIKDMLGMLEKQVDSQREKP